MMPITYTRRKFYNKWSYKVSLNLRGSAAFRLYDYDHIIMLLTTNENIKLNYWTKDLFDNQENVLKVATVLNYWPADIYTKRIERNILDLYTNSEEFFDQISHQFSGFIQKRFAPDPTTKHLLTEGKKIILSKKLAHNKYRFKVFLSPHKIANDVEKKIKFLNFLENNKDHISASSRTKEWFLETKWNWDRRYIHVDNEKTLMMLKLFSSDAINSIYEYVVVDK